MNCPKCFEPLRIADRQGIEIDYCPECRGVWLDKGELDKIIERTMQADFNRPSPSEHRDDHRSGDRHYKDSGKYRGDHYKKHKHYKKKHIIKEIFDFFD